MQFRFPEFQIVTVNTNIRYDAPGGIQSRLSEAVLSDCKLNQIALASSGGYFPKCPSHSRYRKNHILQGLALSDILPFAINGYLTAGATVRPK